MLLEIAYTKEFVRQMFEGRVDLAGKPYHLHCEAVADALPIGRDPKITIDAVHAALLHDIVEDTSVTLHDLKCLGYNEHVVKMVDDLTIPASYIAEFGKTRAHELYVEDVCMLDDYETLRVKLADVEHNLDPARNPDNPKIQQWALKRYWPVRNKILRRMFVVNGGHFII